MGPAADVDEALGAPAKVDEALGAPAKVGIDNHDRQPRPTLLYERGVAV